MRKRDADILVRRDHPGIQYVVVDQESTLVEKAAGLANIAKGVPLTQENTMAAFSMTKTLTAIAVLQLVENGKIRLDEKASVYIEHPYDTDITVRHLLSHTSGIPNPIPLRWVHLASGHDAFDEQEALNQVLRENPHLVSPPGARYRYSNIGYWLLGKLIEAVGQKEYASHVREHIFEPLMLTPDEIAFSIADEVKHAKGYLKKWSLMNLFGRFFIDTRLLGKEEDGWLRIENVYVNGPSFGGAIGTAKAFARILQDLLSDRSILLKEETKHLLYAQQTTSAGNAIEMTLGWHIGRRNGVPYYYKEGGGAGFHCEMHIYPEKGIASVLMANRTSLNTRKILAGLDESLVSRTGSKCNSQQE